MLALFGEGESDRTLTIPFKAIPAASADECEIVAMLMGEVHTAGGPPANLLGDKRVVLLDIAYGWTATFDAGWSAPTADALSDLLANREDRRLDLCPGLRQRLNDYGWSFGRTARDGGYHWSISRIGFSADRTNALAMFSEGWGGPTGDGGVIAWFKKDTTTGRWTRAGGGGALVS